MAYAVKDEFMERWDPFLCFLTDRVTFASTDFVTATQMAVVNKGLGVELWVITVLHCQEL